MPSPGGELGVDWWYTVTARCDYDVDTVGEYTRDEMLDALTYTFEFVVTDDLDETERDRVEVAVEWKDIPSNKVTDENEDVVKIIAWCPDHATAVKVLHEFFFCYYFSFPKFTRRLHTHYMQVLNAMLRSEEDPLVIEE
jgi:hypothetical protein